MPCHISGSGSEGSAIVFAALRVEKHPDKTFIGRVAKGFDFLGYHISHRRLAVSAATRARFKERMNQLYEQQRRSGTTSAPALGNYVRRWIGWVRAGGDVDLATVKYLLPAELLLLDRKLL